MKYKIPNSKVKESDLFKIENKKGYYGWANFNTWQVALNIDNDEEIGRASCRERV